MGLLGKRWRLFKKAVLQVAYLNDAVNDAIRYQIVKQHLINSVLNSEAVGVSPEKIINEEVVVSLTTHSTRIYTVFQTIETLLLQSVKPNRVVLYLNEDEFSFENLPTSLQRQCKRGLEIRFVKDLGVYTKLLPALQEFPDSVIITVDDDYMYPFDLLERLLSGHKSYPEAVVCFNSRILKLSDRKSLAPYSSFEMCFPKQDKLSISLMAEGFGGVLYPPQSMSKEVFDLDMIRALSPHADDLWFKAMQLLKDTPVLQLARNHTWFHTITSEMTAQDIALTHINIDKNGNDIQLKAIFDHYDLYHMITP